MDIPQQTIASEETWYHELLHSIGEFGFLEWSLLGCTAIGVITVGCFFIGKSQLLTKYIPVMPLIQRLLKTWRNLLKGK